MEEILYSEELLKKYNKIDMLYIRTKQDIKSQYKEIEKYEDENKIAREIIKLWNNNRVEHHVMDIDEIDKIILGCYDSLARNGNFEAFMIAMEWYRKAESKFYQPRMKILKKHGIVQAMQDLSDRKYKILSISMPPRTGKSTISLFYVMFKMGMNPNRAILGSGHSTALVQSFYKEIIGFLTNEEYRFSEIFPDSKFVDNNGEYLYIDLSKKKRFHSITFRSIGGSITGAVEADQLLYIDDLIEDREQAENPVRLEKVWLDFNSTLKDRMLDAAQMLSIGTQWNLNDVISRIERAYIDDPKVKILRISCYDENGESNFVYDNSKGFSTEYYKDIELTEDPVIFSAKYKAEPIERDGRPFTDLQTYMEKPSEDPDRILSAVDVAFGGGDRYCMPVAYVYGNDVYIDDVIYELKGLEITRPLTRDMIIRHKIQRAHFEANNGGDLVAEKVSDMLKEKKYKCNVTHKKAPTTKSKLDRILAVRDEILGIATNLGSYNLFFKDKSISNKEYKEFILDIKNFSQSYSAQGKQKDDCIDAVANLITNVLSGGKIGKATSNISRKDLRM